jgi:ParB/RepB/Spo0J family partition protein
MSNKTTTAQDFQQLKAAQLFGSTLNPRKYFNEAALQELAESVSQKGIIQPMVARPVGVKYEIVCGERRYRAGVIAKLKTFPVVIRELTDAEALELMITENLQRQDVHPMEEAQAMESMLTSGMTEQDISIKLGKSLAYITQRLKFTNLIEQWQKLFYDKRLAYMDAFKVARLSPEQQLVLLEDKNLNGTTADEDEEFEDDENDLAGQVTTADNSLIEFRHWDFNSFRYDLNEAKFDLTDKKLIKGAGACTTCPFNSAVATLLFPDMSGKSYCTKVKCFDEKEIISEEKQIKRLIEQGATVACGYSNNDRSKATIQRMREAGLTVLEYYGYNALEKSNAVESFEDWCKSEQYDYAEMDEEEKTETDEDYKRYCEDKAEELTEYEADALTAIPVEFMFGNRHNTSGFVNVNEQRTPVNLKPATPADGEELDNSQLNYNIGILKSKMDRVVELNNEKTFEECKRIASAKEFNQYDHSGVLVNYYFLLNCDHDTREAFCRKHKIDTWNSPAILLQKIAEHSTPEEHIQWKQETLIREFSQGTITISTAKGAALLQIVNTFEVSNKQITAFQLELESKSAKRLEKAQTEIDELKKQLPTKKAKK